MGRPINIKFSGIVENHTLVSDISKSKQKIRSKMAVAAILKLWK
jgi:hypothetical protein